MNPDSNDTSPNLPSDKTPEGYALPGKSTAIGEDTNRQAAVNVIKAKLDALYDGEPNASQELAEAETVMVRSQHQEFIHELANSGKSLAEVQTEWHRYYITLPEAEKHKVWQEFYDSNQAASQYHKIVKKTVRPAPEQVSDGTESAEPKKLVVHAAPKARPKKLKDARNAREVRDNIRHHVTAGGTLKAKHHLQSLMFGLGIGAFVIFIFMFSFFNEFFIAPFIQPNRNASATPLILSTSSVSPTATPEVIIPKINVEIPVNYTESSTNESDIENDLESGVVHYPTTVLPGQNGNAAFFGHSSNNIFNKGKYKFAFVLLHTLVPGDTFYLTNGGKVYVYKVISKNIVPPTDVSVLDPVAGQTATATLITCDPPGTSLNRLIIVGQQISPDPSTNTAPVTPQATTTTTSTQKTLPGNGPTLLTRLLRNIF